MSKEGGRDDWMKIIYTEEVIGDVFINVNINNIGSMNMDLVTYQSRGTFCQVSALRGTNSLLKTHAG